MPRPSLVTEDAIDQMDELFNKHAIDPEKHDLDFDAFATARSLVLNDEENKAQPEAVSQTEPLPPHKVEAELQHIENNGNANHSNDSTIIEEANEEYEEGNKRFVTPKDFELLKVIGIGSFGKVLQVRNKESKKVAAMKIISKRLLKRKVSYVENVRAEVDILTKVRHPFVVTMHCSFQTKEKLFIIMDFLAGGELFLRLGREGIFLEKTAAFYLGEITLALEHLHSHGILHRDLKPENILLGADGHTCLTDFGLAKDFTDEGGFGDEDSKARTVCGTQEYMAPEMVARKGYGRAADFWSLGCIAYEMLSGDPPFVSKKGAKELFRKIMQERVRMPDGSTAGACKLLKGLLNRNVIARLGAARSTMFEVGGVAGLKQCDFFRGMDWDKLEQKEIAPPLKFEVDNDEDLRHFHDEFIQMALPRSVTEMSKDDFEPRRCASDVFRGFSFVQHDFQLPNRRQSEDHKYWNMIEEDGESASDCASSNFGEDRGSGELPPTAPMEPVLEKKKRPPRKRKKKKAVDSDLTETVTNEASTPSDNGDKAANDEKPQQQLEKESGTIQKEAEIKESNASALQVLSQSEELDAANKANTLKNTPMATPQLFPNVAAPVAPRTKVQVWAEVGKDKKSPTTLSSSSAIPALKGPDTPQRITQATSLRTSAQPYQPSLGAWAVKTQKAATKVQALSTPWGQDPPAADVGNKMSPVIQDGQNGSTGNLVSNSRSTDWRDHKMVPVSPAKPKNPLDIDASAFPSLGGASTSSTSSAPSAWGSKTKTQQGAMVWKR